MSSHIYLTHIQDLTLSAQQQLVKSGYCYEHVPIVKEKRRFIAQPAYTDFAIVTSFTAIKYSFHMLKYFSRVYCIGGQTAEYAQELGLDCQKIYRGVHPQPSLENLFHQENDFLKTHHGTWYGSHAGVYKHRDLIGQYPNIDWQITHWNWPNFLAAKNLALLAKNSTVICSSTSAATAIGGFNIDDSVQLIVSSDRLKKHFSATCQKNIHISTRWLSGFVGNLL